MKHAVLIIALMVPFAFGVRHGIRAYRSSERAFLEEADYQKRKYERQESRIRQYLP